MAFKKGQSGNPNGRAPGKQNKTTTDMSDFIKQELEEAQERFMVTLHTMESEAYCRVYSRLMEYVLPKQKDVSMEVSAPPLTRYVLDDGTILEI